VPRRRAAPGRRRRSGRPARSSAPVHASSGGPSVVSRSRRPARRAGEDLQQPRLDGGAAAASVPSMAGSFLRAFRDLTGRWVGLVGTRVRSGADDLEDVVAYPGHGRLVDPLGVQAAAAARCWTGAR
jgi:hypothetical protein